MSNNRITSSEDPYTVEYPRLQGAVGINRNDNIHNIAKLTELNDKLFAECFPHTRRDILYGRIKIEGTSDFFVGKYIWEVKKEETTLLRKCACVLGQYAVPRSLPLSSQVLPLITMQFAQLLYLTSNRHKIESLKDVFKRVRFFLETDVGMENVNAMFCLGQPRAAPGTFSRRSPLAKLISPNQFVKAFRPLLGDLDFAELQRQCERVRFVSVRYICILGDLEPEYNRCWKCEKVFEDLQQCSQCKAACYCSRKCQSKAWKGDHDKKCKRLAEVHDRFVAGVRELDKAHQTSKLEGFLLDLRTDYKVFYFGLRYIVEPDSLPMPRPAQMFGGVVPEGPSMKFYYENLARIIRREWWIYKPQSEQESDVGLRIQGVNPVEMMEARAIGIRYFLSFDYFGAAASKGITDPQKITDAVHWMLVMKPIPPMPVDTFLEMYPSSDDGFHIRPGLKLSAYRILRQMK